MEQMITTLLEGLISKLNDMKKIPEYPYCISKETRRKGVILKGIAKEYEISSEDLKTKLEECSLVEVSKEDVNYSAIRDGVEKVFKINDTVAFLPGEDALKEYVMQDPVKHSQELMTSPLSPIAMDIISEIQNDNQVEGADEVDRKLDAVFSGFGDSMDDDEEAFGDSEATIIDSKLSQMTAEEANVITSNADENSLDDLPSPDVPEDVITTGSNPDVDPDSINDSIGQLDSIFDDPIEAAHAEEPESPAEKTPAEVPPEVPADAPTEPFTPMEPSPDPADAQKAETVEVPPKADADTPAEPETEKFSFPDDSAEEKIAPAGMTPTIPDFNEKKKKKKKKEKEAARAVKPKAPVKEDEIAQEPSDKSKISSRLQRRVSPKGVKKKKVKFVSPKKEKDKGAPKEKAKKKFPLIPVAVSAVVILILFSVFVVWKSRKKDVPSDVKTVGKEAEVTKPVTDIPDPKIEETPEPIIETTEEPEVIEPEKEEIPVKVVEKRTVIYVQAGSYTQMSSAEGEIETFKALGYNSYVVEAEIKGTLYYRVRLDAEFDSRDDAVNFIEKVKKSGWKEYLYPFTEEK
ncbi:SPOR domain-containing protein [bacterium]|nr:SPOR domain-containing protein [bacterium]